MIDGQRLPQRAACLLLVFASHILVTVSSTCWLADVDPRHCEALEHRVHHHLTSQARQLQLPLHPKKEDNGRRHLASIPATIRVFTELQLPSTMPTSNVTYIQEIVKGAVLSLQTYIQVKVPIPSPGLTAAPIRIASCSQGNSQGGYSSATTCNEAGYFPSFASGLPSTDIKSPYCGPARINPNHVKSSAACFDGSGRLIPSCDTNAAGGNGGESADIYLYVTSDTASCANGVAAFALPCLFDPDTNRPIMATFNICPVALESFTPDKLVSTALHEITHTLGYANSLYRLYLDPTTGTRVNGTGAIMKTITTATSTNLRKNYSILISPKVVAEVRTQFNCSTLEGAPLEDQGGSGSRDSHWEYELFQGDIMTPTKNADASDSRFSRLTLALLEDTGWYLGNWSLAAYLDWGRNAGCDFVQLTAAAFMAKYASVQQPWFCNATASVASPCTANGLSSGYCSVDSFSAAGSGLIFSYTTATGIMEPACTSPYFYNAGDAMTHVKGIAAYGWWVGPNARCLPTTLPLASFSPYLSLGQAPAVMGFCFNATCNSTGSLFYEMKGMKVECPAGKNVNLTTVVGGLSGTVKCPVDPALVCRTLQCPASCDTSAGGICFEGKCICRVGFSGPSCSTALMSVTMPEVKALPNLPGGFLNSAMGAPGSSAPGSNADNGGTSGANSWFSGNNLVGVVTAGGVVCMIVLVGLTVVALSKKTGAEDSSVPALPADKQQLEQQERPDTSRFPPPPGPSLPPPPGPSFPVMLQAPPASRNASAFTLERPSLCYPASGAPSITMQSAAPSYVSLNDQSQGGAGGMMQNGSIVSAASGNASMTSINNPVYRTGSAVALPTWSPNRLPSLGTQYSPAFLPSDGVSAMQGGAMWHFPQQARQQQLLVASIQQPWIVGGPSERMRIDLTTAPAQQHGSTMLFSASQAEEARATKSYTTPKKKKPRPLELLSPLPSSP